MTLSNGLDSPNANYLNLLEQLWHEDDIQSDPYPSSLLATLLSIPAPVDKAMEETNAREASPKTQSQASQSELGRVQGEESFRLGEAQALLSVA